MDAFFVKIRGIFVSHPKLIWIVAFYLFLINIAAYIFCSIDKYYRNRTPKKTRKKFNDKYFILFTVLGGGIGIMIGRHAFKRRETNKFTKSIIPAIVMLYLLLFVFILFAINS